MNEIIKRVEYVNEDGETVILLHEYRPIDFIKVELVLPEDKDDE